MRPLPLAALLALSVALAAPLLGSRGSVAEGGFCQAYGCTLTRREEIAPDLLGQVSYDYRLRAGGGLVVVRDQERAVSSATLYGVPFTGNLTRDFSRAFAGVAFEPSAVARCMKQASDEGELLAAGTAGQLPYRATCYRIGGRLLFAIERPDEGLTF